MTGGGKGVKITGGGSKSGNGESGPSGSSGRPLNRSNDIGILSAAKLSGAHAIHP